MSKTIDKDKILKLYSEGSSSKEISEMTGYSKTTINKHLKAAGIWIDKDKIDQEIVSRYKSGQSNIKIAKDMGICRNTVSARLRANNVELRKIELEPEEFIKLYGEGLLIKEISGITNHCQDTISKKLKKHGIKITNHLPDLSDDEVMRVYTEKKTLIDTANHFKSDIKKIRKILIRLGINNFRAKNWNHKYDQEIVSMYRSGMSAYQIADKFGYSHTTVLKNLRRLEILPRNKYLAVQAKDRYKTISDSQFKNIMSCASIRNINFEVTKEYVYQLYLSQDKICAISGVEITLPMNYLELSCGSFTASLDRIDSSKGYTEGNLQWVHKKINIMKQDMSDNEFIAWCKIVSSHHHFLP